MFRHTKRPLESALHLRFSSSKAGVPRRALPRVGAASAGVVAAATLWYLTSTRVIQNDAPAPEISTSSAPLVVEKYSDDDVNLNTLVWGSNQSHLLLPSADPENALRTPRIAKWLQNVALRDLSLHKSHAACVDARGDVYQWGDSFFDSSPTSASSSEPKLTLRGKNIVALQLTEHRVFALSSSGKIYTFSAHSSQQDLSAGEPTPSSDAWFGTGWFWGEEQTIDFAEITSDQSLSRGEKFTSISAGNDHLLAATSKGRTFAHPFTNNSNLYGQLGIRHFDVPEASASTVHAKSVSRRSVELKPKSLTDPYSRSSPVKRALHSSTEDETAVFTGTDSIRASDHLFEIPSLRGLDVVQVSAGSRSSFVLTSSGKVLGWGANEYGQIGLGANVTLDTITVPTEVVLWRTVPGRTRTKCLRVVPGGDLTCFVVERSEDSSVPTIDLLMAGNGQWGGLGNNVYTSAQGNPVRAKNVSGLLEYSEANQKLEAIHPYAVSVSPTGHVLLTLETLARSGPGGGGRDLLGWGANHEYELGNNKRASAAAPTALSLPDGRGRFMLGKRSKAAEVKDMSGKVWKRGVEVEQCAVAGYKNSVVYWKIC